MTNRLPVLAVLLPSVFAACLALPAAAQTPLTPRLRAIIESCAPCHGADGIAKDTEVPHLAGQNEVYLQNQLDAFRTGKRRHREMRYVAGELTRAEMDAIASFYAALPRQ
ncbi:MAG: c-type cytochrome [Beijerinckiaceae bacterium]